MGGDAPWLTPELLKGLLEDARDAARSDGNTYGTARGEANLGYVPQVLRNLGYVPLGHGSASATDTHTVEPSFKVVRWCFWAVFIAAKQPNLL